MNNQQKSIGNIIKAARQNKKLTQEKLASLIDCNKSFVSFMEKERHLPSYETAVLLCQKLGLDFDNFWELVKDKRLKNNLENLEKKKKKFLEGLDIEDDSKFSEALSLLIDIFQNDNTSDKDKVLELLSKFI